MMKLCNWILFFTLLLLTACAPAQTPAPSPTAAAPAAPTATTAAPPAAGATPGAAGDLANTQWQLVSFTEGGTETPAIEGTALTLAFQEGGQAEGQGGCNGFGAQYQVEGDSLAIRELVSTLRACAEDQLNQQETRYFTALQSATRYAINGDQLTIWYGGENTINFTRLGG